MSTSATSSDGTPPDQGRLGPYRLVGTLGQGGMGVVHMGLDRAGRAVAIKVLRPHVAADADARARLAREVASLERVQHPRVAAVLDADVDGDRPYIVTRYAPGPPLDAYVEEHGPFRGDALVRLARGLVEAVEAIHAAGVVHRDLKPGNVLVVDGEPVVIDLGIAHVAEDARLTSTGLVMGTPGYLSPEVLQGAPVSESTDWWGWAATLAFAATGHPPFGTGRVDVILDRVRAGDHDLADVDPRLRPLLAAALSPDPALRPSAHTVVEALERVAAGGTPALGVGASGRTELIPVVPAAGATQVVAPPTARLPRVQERTARPAPPPVPAQPVPAQPVPAQPVPAQPVPAQPATARPAPAQPAPAPVGDPRLGAPARSIQLTALTGVVAALAATWPVLALVVALGWSLLARTVDRSVTATVLRRYEAGGRRSTDGLVAALRSPFQLLGAALSTLVAGLLGLLVAVATMYAVSLGATLAGMELAPTASGALAVGALAGCLACWWGSGGVSLRRGSRTLMRGITPGTLGPEVVTALLVAAGLGLALWAVLVHGVPQWAPLPGDPLRDQPLTWQL